MKDQRVNRMIGRVGADVGSVHNLQRGESLLRVEKVRRTQANVRFSMICDNGRHDL